MNDSAVFACVWTALGDFDEPFGYGVADWDRQVLTVEEQHTVLNQFVASNSNTAGTVMVINCPPAMYAEVSKAMVDRHFVDTHPLYWYKEDQNLEGPRNNFIFAVEQMVVGYHGGRGACPTYLDKNPLERHNIITGRCMKSYLVHANGQRVNPHEKPAYLTKAIGGMMCAPGSWVLVIGGGAGGSAEGYLDAGLNVVVVESDPVQFEAMKSRFTQKLADAGKVAAEALVKAAKQAKADAAAVALAIADATAAESPPDSGQEVPSTPSGSSVSTAAATEPVAAPPAAGAVVAASPAHTRSSTAITNKVPVARVPHVIKPVAFKCISCPQSLDLTKDPTCARVECTLRFHAPCGKVDEESPDDMFCSEECMALCTDEAGEEESREVSADKPAPTGSPKKGGPNKGATNN